MADTLSLTVKASVAWLFQDALDLTTVVDQATAQFSKTMADGTAADQADKIWSDTRSVASGANDDLDLAGGLTQSIFGSTVTITFVKIKGIYIKNKSTTAGEELVLNSAVANSILTPFNGSNTSKVEIGPDSCLLLSSNKDGWAVTAGTADILRIANAASAAPISYDIVIWGTSA